MSVARPEEILTQGILQQEETNQQNRRASWAAEMSSPLIWCTPAEVAPEAPTFRRKSGRIHQRQQLTADGLPMGSWENLRLRPPKIADLTFIVLLLMLPVS